MTKRHAAPRASRKRAARRPRRLRTPRIAWVAAAAALLAVALVVTAAGMVWAEVGGPGPGRRIEVHIPRGATRRDVAEALHRAGLLRSPRWFTTYLAVLRPGARPRPGPHLLPDDLSPRQLATWVGGGAGRPTAKIVVPEGFHRFQIADRLEAAGVCSKAAFLGATEDRHGLTELGIRGPSAEGYLFPLTYVLPLDSDPGDLVRRMVTETRKRLTALNVAGSGSLDRISRTRGWGEHEVLTLASMVEKEAGDPAERPLIAGVLYNRLDSATFRPRRMLQSDPTAAYGCLVTRPPPTTCTAKPGKVTAAMVRDASNPYNTYKHAGLPPGPIANPGSDSLRAVLEPTVTEHLYFVATGDGRHAFSRTLEEHEAATARAARGSP